MDTSYLTQQVNNIVGQLHGLFDEMGVPSHERESREAELFSVLADTLTGHVRKVTSEKDEMIAQAQNIITTIRQMEASLDEDDHDHTSRPDSDELRVTLPLSRCLQTLKEKHSQVSRLYRERYEQVKKLVQALESYSSHLEPNFVRIALPPTGEGKSSLPPPTFDLSNAYIEQLDKEFTRVYEEYSRRTSTVQSIASNIISLWAELGTPQAQTEPTISKFYRDSPEQLGLHEDDISRLRVRRDKLAVEKRNREKRLQELRTAVDALWQKLGIEEADQNAFVNANRGCGLRQVTEFEDELARLGELKRQNLHLFVEDARYKLQELWDTLYLSEDEMLEFTPAFSDVYSDALLEVHERELARLEMLKEEWAPILSMIEKYRSLVAERDELAASSQDASRLMMRGQKGEKRDPGKLLREEKSRKRIAKELPKVTADLQKALEDWEEEQGRPFFVHGERYIDVLSDKQATAKTPGPRSKTPAGLKSAAAAAAAAAAANPGRANSTTCATISKPMAPNRGLSRTPTAPVGRVGRSATVSHPSGPTPNGSTTSLVAPSTPGPTAGSAATVANSKGSPTRVQNRAPLAALRNGASSPERRPDPQRPASSSGSRGPPLIRAPPPKLRDLATVPELPRPSNPYTSAGLGSSSSVNLVRPTSPDDVFDDRSRDTRHARSKTAFSASQRGHAAPPTHDYDQYEERDREPGRDRERDLLHLRSKSAMTSSISVHSNNSHQSLAQSNRSFARSQQGFYSHRSQQQHDSYTSSERDRDSSQTDYQRPDTSMSSSFPARHTSNSNSSHSTIMSGSENWETYDDSEPELDASDTYFAKVRAARSKMESQFLPQPQQQQQHQHQQKQQQYSNGAPPPASLGMSQANIKMYGGRSLPSHAGHVTVDAEGNRIISGSEWADDEEAY
jgi:protein regulator of cytokinesis 1